MVQPCRIAAFIALGLALTSPPLFAQATAGDSAPRTTAIPPDQQPAKEQLAKLFEVMRLRQQMQNVMKMLPAVIQQQVQTQIGELTAKMPGGTPTPEQQAAIDKLMNKYMTKAFDMYTIDEMFDDMTGLYQRHMSRSDVEAFIAFYSSPAGQHMLNEQPAIMQEYMPMVMKRVQERSKALTDEMSQDMDEFLKSAASSASKPDQK